MAFDAAKHPRDPRTGRFISLGSRLAKEVTAARSKQGAGKFPKLGAKLSGHETKAELQVVAKKAGISTKKSDTRAALLARIEAGEKAKAPAAKPKAAKPSVAKKAAPTPPPAPTTELDPAAKAIGVAYSELVGKTDALSDWVGLAAIRDKVKHLSRDEQDAALRKLNRMPGVHVHPLANFKSLTPADRAAAMDIGDEQVHAIRVDAKGRESLGLPAASKAAQPGRPPVAAPPRDRALAEIANLSSGPGDLVALSRLRARMPELSHDEFTALLKQMDRERIIQLDPDPNRKAGASAITVGGEAKHLVSIP